MHIMRVLLAKLPQSMDEAVRVIARGGIVAHATETCYGFACNLTNPEAVSRLFTLKNRSEDHSISALFPSLEKAKEWVEWNEEAEKLAKEYLPGPLTIVLPLKKAKGNGETLGIRISSHPVAEYLAKYSGVPLSTTSANLHGKPSPYSPEEILEQFRGRSLQPDLILDSGTLDRVAPSTVVQIQKGVLEVLRQGTLRIVL